MIIKMKNSGINENKKIRDNWWWITMLMIWYFMIMMHITLFIKS